MDADDEEESSGPLFGEVNLCYLTILDYIAGGRYEYRKGPFPIVQSLLLLGPFTLLAWIEWILTRQCYLVSIYLMIGGGIIMAEVE